MMVLTHITAFFGTAFNIWVLLAIAIASLLIFALLSRKENRLANRLLSVVIFVIIYGQYIQYLDVTGIIVHHPILIRSKFPLEMSAMVLLYLYVCALTGPQFHLTRKELWHLLPVAIGVIWYITPYLLFRDYDLWTVSRTFLMERFIRGFLELGIAGFYFFLCFKRLHFYRNRIMHYFSELHSVRLSWLEMLLICLSSLWAIHLWDLLQGPWITMWHVMIPAVTIVTFLLAFFSLRQSIVFSAEAEELSVPEIVSAPSANKTEFLFSDKELVEWRQKLRTFVEKESPYLNPELRLHDLASSLKLKPNQLSEILNRGEKLNFFEFINRYRIAEVKNRLRDSKYDHMNLLGIANDAGFNSKSVFNETFKRMTGTTPSAYRNESPKKKEAGSEDLHQ